MLFSISSVFITLVMSTILILLFVIFITQEKLINFLRMDVMMVFAFVIVIRLLFPVELPFTITIPFPLIMNELQTILEINILPFLSLSQILCLVWGIGFMVQLIRYVFNVKKIYSIMKALEKIANHKHVSDYIEIDPNYDYPIWVTGEIASPVVIGFNKTILLPDLKLETLEIQGILKHEIQHICNHDNLIKQIVNFLKIIYWWFLPVYWFSDKIQLVLEMRADQQVTKEYKKAQVYNYADTLLRLKRSVFERESNATNILPISSNFIVGDDEKILTYRIQYLLNSNYSFKTNVFALFILLLFPILTNLVIFEAYTPPPVEDYYVKSVESEIANFILKHEDGTYSLFKNGVFEEITDFDSGAYSGLPIIDEMEGLE